MKLKDVIIQAQKHKCTIKNTEFRMFQQTAKSLIHWLFVNTEDDFERIELVIKYLKSDNWQLDKKDENDF